MRHSIPHLVMITALVTADTLNVPSEYSSIFSAIGAAQNGDTVLVAPGNYNGGFGFQGKNIVVRSSLGMWHTYLESPFADWHCVMFTEGEDSTAVLEGFSITNGNFDGDGSFTKDPPDHGGGIYITNSSPTIRDCRIINCFARSGAGIYVSNSSSLIENCTLSGNHAYDGSGGGMSAGGIRITDSPFRVYSCTINGNESDVSGGLSITHQNTEIINNTIVENIGGTGQGAGGIGINSPSTLLYGNYIAFNDGATGGGVSISGGSPVLMGNVIVENTAGHGGGIHETSIGTVVLNNNTIAFNKANTTDGWGGGLLSWKDSINISNCVFYGNTGAYGSQLCVAGGWIITITDISYSNVQYGQNMIYTDSFSVLNWGSGNIDTDPLFETGPLCDYHLSLSSPCIDAGNPASEYNDPEDPFNPGNALWPAMGNLRNDMGAFGGGGVNYWLSLEEEETSFEVGTLPLHTFPNPFKSSCTVSYQLSEPSRVSLSVFDISGRLVKTLADEYVLSGQHTECFDASDLCPGVYLIRIVAGGASASQRCVVVR